MLNEIIRAKGNGYYGGKQCEAYWIKGTSAW
jgi:hypothetical protein